MTACPLGIAKQDAGLSLTRYMPVANLREPAGAGDDPFANLCALIGNMLPSSQVPQIGRLFSSRALFHPCTSRRGLHRLQPAAPRNLGPKPVACTGSLFGLLNGGALCAIP